MKKRFVYIILIYSFVVTLHAQDTRYSASYLELGIGARALGMGSAYVALSDDATGFYWNPAGMAFQSRIEVAAMHANLFNDLERQNYLSFAVPIFGGATVSVGAIGLFIDDIGRRNSGSLDSTTYSQRIDDDNIQLKWNNGYFNSYEIAAFFTFAKYFRWDMDLGWQYFKIPIDIGVGLNFKYLTQKLDDKSGSGLGIDLGFIIRMPLNEVFQESFYGDLTFGINLQDIAGTSITWDTDSKHKDRIDYNIKYGISYVQPLSFMDSQFTLAYDIDTKYRGATHLGGEFLFKSMLAVRIGISAGRFTTGAGIYFWKFKFDYAYQGHDLGNTHRISLLFGF
ncbi:MAG TPA: PorV/PorQ family protein [Calditrichaeota bacterium]|nr:PorV/PorQ family protein [Calditrichota bacterium]